MNDTDQEDTTTHKYATYTGASLTWNPGGSIGLGGEFLYGWSMKQNGFPANAPRIQFSAKYSFVKMVPNAN